MISLVYNNECTGGMKLFGDKEFKLAIVDPPYFSGPEKRKYYGKEHSGIGVKRIDYDVTEDWKLPDAEYFAELFRVSEHQIIWGCNYFDYIFPSGRIVWDKVNGDSSFSDCEIAYCSMHKSTRLFRYMWNGMMQGKSISEGHIMQGNKKLNEKRIHPTQKPVELLKYLCKTYTNEFETVLDNTMGSGSTGVACKELNRHFIGIEKDEKYFEIAVSRVSAYCG